ncbi:pre-mRNA-splicing factor 38A [Ischnura elegans]|uniref:pre-mRNA-splicing factor 38A n=1 Tax=Ischnura elegans TaxID=197161 RepID=UPI001ED8A1CD|nr:pre-mRNA-splicing factor 38A [Ischnura elegans]
MANRTVKDAKSIRGTNPQYLVEKIIRSRIYDSRYWKEECFALTAELMVDKAMELRYVGGVYGGNIKPSPFLCLILKMLQIQPEKDIIVEFIKNEEFKYVRVLGAFYMRLVGTSLDCYKYLEPLLNDYRKLRRQNRLGQFELVHVDEFIDELLREDRICDVILPRLQKRYVLEENNETDPRVSALDDDLDEGMESDEDGELDGGIGDILKKDGGAAMANGSMGPGSGFFSSGNSVPSLLKSRDSGGNMKGGGDSNMSSGNHRHHHHHHHGGANPSSMRQSTKDKGRKPSPTPQNRPRRSRSRERDLKEREKRHRSRERDRPSDKRERKWDANQSWERRHHRGRSKSPTGRTHRHRDEDHGRTQHNARDTRSSKDWNSSRGGERDRHGTSGSNRHRSERNARTGRRSDANNEVNEANALRAKLGLPPLRH